MSDRYHRSRELFARAEQTLAGGVSSNVRRGDKPLPLYFDRGVGSRLFDVDGNEYIDYVLGRGPLILGHTHPEVIEASCRQLRRGQIYAAQHVLEVELAERVTEIVPSAERVRFGISGSEAVHAALRLARAFTGRETVLKFEGHYHGWLDNILYSLSPDVDRAGDAKMPEALRESGGQFSARDSRVRALPWNDFEALDRYLDAHAGETAAIITEPIMCNTGVILPADGYLDMLRQVCTRHGIVLIFDEVITGFRVSLAGAQGLFGIRPDLSIFGKAIANGMPMSCIAGRADILDLIAQGKVGHGGTYNSLPAVLAAAVSTLDILRKDNGAIYERMRKTGSALMDGIKRCAARVGVPAIVQGHPAIFYVAFPTIGEGGSSVQDYRSSLKMDNDLYSEFVSALAKRGVRVIPRGNWFLSAAHDEADVELTLQAVEEALLEVAVPYYAEGGVPDK
jgi:glutamate-1-semialdehyde 2,1-aminomutase